MPWFLMALIQVVERDWSGGKWEWVAMMVLGERSSIMSGWRESSSLCLPRMRMSGVSFGRESL